MTLFIIKKSELTELWAIENNKPEPPYFLSYDDAYNQYEEMNDTTEDDDFGEYHSITKIQIIEPIPLTGRMWMVNNRLFSTEGDALELDDNPILIEVKVV